VSKVKAFFSKPSMPFDKILLLGFCELLLIVIKEEHGRFYGLINNVYYAVFTAVILALFLRFIRLINEVRAGK